MNEHHGDPSDPKRRLKSLLEAIDSPIVDAEGEGDLVDWSNRVLAARRLVDMPEDDSANVDSCWRVRYTYLVLVDDQVEDMYPWTAVVRARSAEEAEAKFRAHHVADGGREDCTDLRNVRVAELNLDDVLLFPEGERA
jgi:hypothetical protein